MRKAPRPSLAQVAIAAFLALVVLPRAAVPLIDGDVWWHIRAGLELLETGRVPSVDAWSIAGAGMPWTSQDWLSNVLLASLTGGAVGGAGAMGASVLFASLVVVTAALLWWALDARGVRGWLGRVVWLSFGIIVAGPALGVRVQVVDLVLAASVLYLLWRYLADPRRRWLIGLPVVALAWANLHAGWVILFLLGGAVLVGEVIDRRLRPTEATLTWRACAELGLALAIAFAALAVNPSGLGLYAYPIQTSLIAAHREYLAEWSPPRLTSVVGQVFWAFAIVGVGSALLLGWRRLRTADLLVLIGLTVMGAYAARFLLVAPLAASVVVIAWSRIPSPPVVSRMSRPAQSARLGAANLALIVAIAGTGIAVAATRIAPSAQDEAIGEHMPVGAVDWIVANDPGDRVFNTYSWGGYLGMRRPDLPIYIDGRSDIYGDGPIREYAQAVLLETDPAELFERRRIDHVLFGVGTPLAVWLDSRPEWEKTYADDLAAVWVRFGDQAP